MIRAVSALALFEELAQERTCKHIYMMGSPHGTKRKNAGTCDIQL